MKKLIALISTEKKYQRQITDEAKSAYKKYQDVSSKNTNLPEEKSKPKRCFTIVGYPGAGTKR